MDQSILRNNLETANLKQNALTEIFVALTLSKFGFICFHFTVLRSMVPLTSSE